MCSSMNMKLSLLTLALVGCSAATEGTSTSSTLSTSSYDPSAAVAYADSHWDDGQGLCAEFTSRSLAAGHLGVGVITYVPTLVGALDGVPYEEHSQGDWPSAKAGDVVVYSDDSGGNFCNDDADEYNCGHVCIVVQGGGSESSIAVDCHNHAHYHIALGDILGGGYSTYRVYHLSQSKQPNVMACSSDEDCNGGAAGTETVCGSSDHYCIRACHSDWDCPDGTTCTPTEPHWSCQ